MVAISKLSRPYPSAACVTEQMCESSLFKSNSPLKLPTVAENMCHNNLPLPVRLLLRNERAMSCDTLPLCVGGGGGGEGDGGGACVCECVCGSPVPPPLA